MTEINIANLRIFRKQSPVQVLGPYQRAVVWVQGCQWGCQGCIVPESWSSEGGEIVSLSELRDWILSQDNIEGVTFSGGEPMLQAKALLNLITQIKQKRDLGIVCYTGYRLEQLQQQGNPAQKAFLNCIDLLIDGLYLQAKHGDLLWRGSTNQRLWLLTERYRSVVEQQLEKGDCSAGLEFSTDTNGELYFTGVPSLVTFRQQFEAQMQEKGIRLKA